jgi:hypothetical protein
VNIVSGRILPGNQLLIACDPKVSLLVLWERLAIQGGALEIAPFGALEIQPCETVLPFCRPDQLGLWILRPESERPLDTVRSE